jgi:hypothetical protein
MSQLKYSLEVFGFSDLNEVTSDTLKKAFKVTVLKAHPDRGGQQDDFDKLLSSYLYLLEIVERVKGGRRTLSNIVSPDELKEDRMDEIINRIFEEFDREEFNQEFEKKNPRVEHGYRDWLHDGTLDTNVTDGIYGSATQKPPTFEEGVLQAEFEHQTKSGKPTPHALILHPEEMAYSSGMMMGTSIIDTQQGCYTSSVFSEAKPEYTDVYSAFTNDNTICDKVTPFVENNKTLDQLIAERNQDIAPLEDKELEAIAGFEKRKLEQEHEHLSKIKDYYHHITPTQSALENWPPTHYPRENYKGFIVEL